MMKPSQILQRLGISKPEEIDIEAIAQYFDATVVYEPVHSCEARIVGSKDEAFISVNPRQSRGRERFSAAHELGHWLLDRGLVTACSADSMIDWSGTRETRANKFASDLLLPLSMFKPCSRGIPATVEGISSLASKFEMSLSATARRLVEHGSEPAIIACYGERGLRWCKRGPGVPDSFWLPKHPAEETIASRLLKGIRVVSPKTWSADTWIQRDDASHYEIVEDCFVPVPGKIIVLLSWEDESQLIESDE